MRKALGRMTVAVMATGALLPAAPAQAATITVSTTADQFGTGPECSLREAISSANADTAEGGCAAGSGSDTVVLPPGTHALTLVDPDDGGGDLDVSSTLTLMGAGPGQTIIEQTGSERVLELLTPGASLAVSGVTIRGGQDSSGGGIALADPMQLTLDDVVVRDNTATQEGGGVYNDGGTVTITGSSILANGAAEGGGLYTTNGGTVTVTNTLIAGNQAIGVSADGGGLANEGSDMALTNVTLSGNAAVNVGGGIEHNGSGSTSINSVTVTGNTAENGGGLYLSGTMNLKNTIVAGNTDTAGPNNPDCVGTLTSGGYNLIGTILPADCSLSAAPGDITGQDPSLGPLADNGGPTQTHALLAGSTAIDTGGDCGATDQRGMPRPQGSGCDRGAYELALCRGTTVNRFGTDGKDTVTGTPGNDGLLGFGGRDRLMGRAGNDRVCGGPGRDTLKGGGGKDVLDGGPGKDICVGSGGRDKARSCTTDKGIP